jgi:apolipoprotein N-acyltransferase
MMNAALALVTLRRPRIELAWLFALLFLTLLPHVPDARRPREGAVLVQPGVSETVDWDAAAVERLERALVKVSLDAVKASAPGPTPAVIVWPEVPAPLYYQEDPGFRNAVDGLARDSGAWVLTGTVAHNPGGAPLNSAVLVAPPGTLVSRYDKVNLVPFGEFVPWPLGAITSKISSEAGDFAAGSRLVISPVNGHKTATFICYESVFPNFVRRFVAGGAEVLFNISNDGWFGSTAARQQHLDIVRMRAAENQRWILRSTNDGITTAIDPGGRLTGTLRPYISAASRSGFTYLSNQTFYTRYGDWFPIVCALAAAAFLVGQGLERHQ